MAIPSSTRSLNRRDDHVVRAFVGVLIAGVALGGALAIHNEVRRTNVYHMPGFQTRCSQNVATRVECRVSGNANGYIVTAASISEHTYKPGWVDPVAITLAVAGGAGFGLLLVGQEARVRDRRARRSFRRPRAGRTSG